MILHHYLFSIKSEMQQIHIKLINMTIKNKHQILNHFICSKNLNIIKDHLYKHKLKYWSCINKVQVAILLFCLIVTLIFKEEK